MASPVEQFQVKPIFPVVPEGEHLPFYAFTNSSLAMVAAVVVATVLFWLATRKRAMVPGRWQSVGELTLELFTLSTSSDWLKGGG